MAAGQAPDRAWLLGSVTVAAGAVTVTGVTAGTSQPVLSAAQGIIAFYFRSVGTTSGGTLLVEEADWDEQEQVYSGTWSVMTTISASSFTGGAQLAYHPSDSAYGWVRVRISSAITGGGTVLVSVRRRGAM